MDAPTEIDLQPRRCHPPWLRSAHCHTKANYAYYIIQQQQQEQQEGVGGGSCYREDKLNECSTSSAEKKMNTPREPQKRRVAVASRDCEEGRWKERG